MAGTIDQQGSGLTSLTLSALRYDGHTDDPHETAGLLHTFMPSRCSVLDVGCGTGSVSLIANRGKNNRVHGIEPDPARAAAAQARGIEVTCGFLDDAFVATHGPFDVVMFADVLEHTPNPAAQLTLARTLLAPGGWLLISVPNAVHWTMRWEILRGRFNYTDCGIRDATHLRWFTRDNLRHLLAHTGFEIAVYRASAGATLPEYLCWRPWRWIPEALRTRFVRTAARAWPSLFGCQHVIQARLR